MVPPSPDVSPDLPLIDSDFGRSISAVDHLHKRREGKGKKKKKKKKKKSSNLKVSVASYDLSQNSPALTLIDNEVFEDPCVFSMYRAITASILWSLSLGPLNAAI